MRNSKKIELLNEKVNQIDHYIHELANRIEVYERKLEATREEVERIHRHIFEIDNKITTPFTIDSQKIGKVMKGEKNG